MHNITIYFSKPYFIIFNLNNQREHIGKIIYNNYQESKDRVIYTNIQLNG